MWKSPYSNCDIYRPDCNQSGTSKSVASTLATAKANHLTYKKCHSATWQKPDFLPADKRGRPNVTVLHGMMSCN